MFTNRFVRIVCGTIAALLSCSAAALAQQVATTVQLPTFGVAIDADGVLTTNTFPDPGGRLRAAHVAAAKAALPKDIFARSEIRKVSLVRLEQAVRTRLAAGEPLDEAMQNLAGLERLQYVFCYPDAGDIVIAGPAEGWAPDAAGRMVGVSTGRPVLRLEELVVALRAFAPAKRPEAMIGCTIDPNPEGLARLMEFQQTVPRSIPQQARARTARRIAEGMRDSLGMSNVRVFGVSDKTRFAQIMVEADYRMKRIGIGLEPPPAKMATFIGSLRGARHGALQRWWFTPDYDCVRLTDDRLAAELVGQGVQLLGEDKLIGSDGALAADGVKPNKASELFTLAFTRKYPEIAANSPVFAQLRNLIDMLVAAALMQREDFAGRCGWSLGVLGDEAALGVETLAPPRKVPCAVNSVWKGNRLFTPAGGGVTIRPLLALEDDRLLADENGLLAESRQQLAPTADEDGWWWD